MSHTRYGIYKSKAPETAQQKEIKQTQNHITEMFDCISILFKKSRYSSLSLKEKKQVAILCEAEKVAIKKDGKFLPTNDIADNLMEKITTHSQRLEKIMSKNEYEKYCKKLVKDEFAKYISLLTAETGKKLRAA